VQVGHRTLERVADFDAGARERGIQDDEQTAGGRSGTDLAGLEEPVGLRLDRRPRVGRRHDVNIVTCHTRRSAGE
jgi:hypothetical protein